MIMKRFCARSEASFIWNISYRMKTKSISVLVKLLALIEVGSLEVVSPNVVYCSKELVGSGLKSIRNVDWLRCIELCATNPNCWSYNFNKPSELCELNFASLCGCGAGEKLLVYQEGSVFHQLYKREVSVGSWSNWKVLRQQILVDGFLRVRSWLLRWWPSIFYNKHWQSFCHLKTLILQLQFGNRLNWVIGHVCYRKLTRIVSSNENACKNLDQSSLLGVFTFAVYVYQNTELF